MLNNTHGKASADGCRGSSYSRPRAKPQRGDTVNRNSYLSRRAGFSRGKAVEEAAFSSNLKIFFAVIDCLESA